MHPDAEGEFRQLRRASIEAQARLGDAIKQMRGVLQDEGIMAETPREVADPVEAAVETVESALRLLKAATHRRPPAPANPDAPTRQQGQFLAFIREYVLRNQGGVAPSHADFQRFFNLTAPSVNSMLIRLESRGFIRRIPGRARAIELVINPDWIPPLDRPFKF